MYALWNRDCWIYLAGNTRLATCEHSCDPELSSIVYSVLGQEEDITLPKVIISLIISYLNGISVAELARLPQGEERTRLPIMGFFFEENNEKKEKEKEKENYKLPHRVEARCIFCENQFAFSSANEGVYLCLRDKCNYHVCPPCFREGMEKVICPAGHALAWRPNIKDINQLLNCHDVIEQESLFEWFKDRGNWMARFLAPNSVLLERFCQCSEIILPRSSLET